LHPGLFKRLLDKIESIVGIKTSNLDIFREFSREEIGKLRGFLKSLKLE